MDCHIAAMDEFHERFSLDHRNALREYHRIEALLRDVVWYNFETVARTWRHPWPESVDKSQLKMESHRYLVLKNRRARSCEKADFLIYFHGLVRDAPPLPPEIVLNELKIAYDDVKRAADNCAAPYEWAPGGRLYEKLLRKSDGVEAYRQLSSKAHSKDGRPRLFLGDPMERQTQANAETTAKNILGRVCGDRSLVCARAGV